MTLLKRGRERKEKQTGSVCLLGWDEGKLRISGKEVQYLYDRVGEVSIILHWNRNQDYYPRETSDFLKIRI